MEINMDAIQRKLAEYAKRLSGDVSLHRLFPSEFLAEHSKYKTIEELLSPAGITSQESFDAWCESGLADKYIMANTDFHSWEEMRDSAARIYAKKKQADIRDESWVAESFDTGDLFRDIHIFLNFAAG